MTRKEELRKQRAELIIKEIQTKLTNVTSDLLKVGKLLNEFKTKRLYTVWDCTSFSQWLVESNLGLSLAQAKNLMNVVIRAGELSLSFDDLEKLGLQKLSAIFSLSPQKHAEQIQDLLEEAPAMSLLDVQASVREKLRAGRKILPTFTLSLSVSEEMFKAVQAIKESTGKNTLEAVKEYFRAQ